MTRRDKARSSRRRSLVETLRRPGPLVTTMLATVAAIAFAILPATPGATTNAPTGQDRGFADLAVTNGKVVTVDSGFHIAEALAIRGGRLVAVGSAADVAA